jgi:CRISPR-associated protein Cas1
MELLNWLYVQDEAASLHLDHDALRIRSGDRDPRTLPLLAIEGVVCFGAVSVSTPLLQRMARDGKSVVLLSRSGRFEARVEGPCRGNVLLRRDQHRALASPEDAREIARSIVAGKIQASRTTLLRAARDLGDNTTTPAVRDAATALAVLLPLVRDAVTIDGLRGYEGDAAATYFGALRYLIRRPLTPPFDRRLRRPPRDPMNALLSFLYTLLRAEVSAAAEAAGLDPQVGFLHALRPGRPALALDLMEELRSPIADRLALRLVNRNQITAADFESGPAGEFSLAPRGRHVVLSEYRTRKQEPVNHPLLKRRIAWALVPHIQARLLARHLRGDLPAYIPFLTK